MEQIKPKVCHLTSAHRWNDIRIFQKECKSLAQSGYEVHLVVPVDELENLNQDGVTIHPVRLPNGRKDRFLNLSKDILKIASAIDADIYQFHDPELLLAGYKLKRLGKYVVYDSHEDTPADILDRPWVPKLLRPIVSFLYGYFEKWISSRLDGVIGVSEELTAKFNHSNATTIKNYPIINEVIEAEKKHSNLPHYGIYIGSLSRVRGIKEIIQSLEYMPTDYSLVIAGKFDNAEFEIECVSLPQWKRVHYLGFIPSYEAYSWLKGAEVGYTVLYPTNGHIYSLPIKNFEYMAAKVPVLMTDIHLWRQTFENNAWYVSSIDPKTIASSAKEILANDEMRNEKTACAYNLILNEMNWEIESKKLVNYYEKLVPNA